MPNVYEVNGSETSSQAGGGEVTVVQPIQIIRRRSSVAIPPPNFEQNVQAKQHTADQAKKPQKSAVKTSFMTRIVNKIHPQKSEAKRDDNLSANQARCIPPTAVPQTIAMSDSIDKDKRMYSIDLSASNDNGVYLGELAARAGSISVSEKGGEGKEVEEEGGDENKERGNWSSQIDCLLSLLGYTVGLGTVWRFPYLCYANGGGAFIFAYLVALIIIGMPLFYMELVLGQFTSRGPLGVWEYSPIFRGLGIAQLFISYEVSIYYNVVLAWAIFYLFSSFTTNLPWITCNNWWNSDLCYDKIPDVPCNGSTFEVEQPNGTCTNGTRVIGVWNSTLFDTKRPSASDEYFYRRLLRISSGIGEAGQVWWDIALCLLLVWVICFFSMLGGIKSSGKVIWVTTIVPYCILVILFGRAVSLPNASEGLIYYIKPDFTKLKDVTVWSTAAVQMFYTLCNCWGGLIVLSSYNRFNTNLYRDTMLITIVNFFTGIFTGCIVFGFLGFLAGYKNLPLDKVADAGPALAFVVYPEAVTKIAASPFWSAMFYLILLTFGLSSQFTIIQTTFTSVLDQFAFFRPHMKKVILFVCVVSYLLGLPLCTSGGSYLLNLMDAYICGWNLLLMGIIETLSVSWLYGIQRFGKDIKIMLGYQPGPWWKACWLALCPLFLGFNLIIQWIYYAPPTFHNVEYPFWAEVLGWLMSISSIIWVPVVAVVLMIWDWQGTLWTTFKKLINPSPVWGPALPQHRALVDYVKGFVLDPWSKQPAEEKTVDVIPSVLSAYENVQETAMKSDSVSCTDYDKKSDDDNNNVRDNNENDTRNLGSTNPAYTHDDDRM